MVVLENSIRISTYSPSHSQCSNHTIARVKRLIPTPTLTGHDPSSFLFPLSARLRTYENIHVVPSRYGYKSIEPIALALENVNVRALQRFVSDAPWDDYVERRTKCNLTAEIGFQSKPKLAAEMLTALSQEEDVLPFKYVLSDSLYGVSPEFIAAVEALPGTTYFVSVPKDTQCWLKRPMTITKKREYRWGGKKRRKRVLVAPEAKPLTVEDLARNTNDYFWYRRKVSEGTKGPIVYEFTRRRVVLSAAGLPKKTVWLLIRRTLGEDPQYSYFISNAMSSTRLNTLVWLSALRWAIEQCLQETKTELGMDHYEVRKFPGWHHPITTFMLAHFFLWHLKIRMGKKSSVHYSVAA